MYDPLAEFLGAADEGLVEYCYADAVRLAGHSCPTVAGAYLMTAKALERLYGAARPERGAIRVELRDDLASGVTGVIAHVVGLLTGAAQAGGFKGIGGRFDRRDLLHFNAATGGEARFVRLDTGAAVVAGFRPERVPAEPRLKALMPRVAAGGASAAEQREFRALWQERVRRILIDHFDDPELVALAAG
ncbi:MAG: FmdE family protein [Burkholderiales bacterium]|nr:FmdE family protein [Burkholderiales bacterium]